jgi:hypothetical protein
MTTINPFIIDFLEKAGKEVIVDANVLILYFVGTANKEYIQKVKATKDIYNEKDYETIKFILSKFKDIITTPNILTEVSNFVGQKDYLKEDLFDTFMDLICSSCFIEEFVDSPKISKDRAFNRFGLTDIAIAKLSEQKIGVITQDFDLFRELERREIPVLNFNYVIDYEK